jgi:serine protease
VGPFGLTSISPTRVSMAGGTYVTITGTAIPADATVRIGPNASAVVSTVSATRLVFTTPGLVAGTYDVHVFGRGGTQEAVLTGGLQYLDTSSSPGTSAASSTASNTSASSTSGGSSSAAATPSWVTGPHGERLVRSALFAALGTTIWKVGCSSSCSGLAV